MSSQIWFTYNDKAILRKNKIKETEDIKLFYTRDKKIEGKSINHAQNYFNDFVTMYYVWKNNIKSDIVAFCNIDNKIEKIDKKLIDKNEGYYLIDTKKIENTNLLDHYNNIGVCFLNYLFLTFLNEKYEYLVHSYMKHIHVNNQKVNNAYSFAFTWEIFNKAMEFIDEYIKYVLDFYKNNQELDEIPVNTYNEIISEINSVEDSLWRMYHKYDNLNFVDFYGFPNNLSYQIMFLIGEYLNFFKNRI